MLLQDYLAKDSPHLASLCQSQVFSRRAQGVCLSFGLSNGLHRLSAALERTPQKNTFKRAARVYPAAMAGDSLPPYEGRLCGMLAGVLQHALKAYLRPSQTHQ